MKTCIFVIAIMGVAALGQQPVQESPQPNVKIKKVPITDVKPTSGVAMYREYCAVCHGPNATGDGPAAPALKVQPSDLTMIAARNNGKFPEMEVVNILNGTKEIASHGSNEMPIWGALFRTLNGHNANVADLRMRNIAEYLKTIQK